MSTCSSGCPTWYSDGSFSSLCSYIYTWFLVKSVFEVRAYWLYIIGSCLVWKACTVRICIRMYLSYSTVFVDGAGRRCKASVTTRNYSFTEHRKLFEAGEKPFSLKKVLVIPSSHTSSHWLFTSTNICGCFSKLIFSLRWCSYRMILIFKIGISTIRLF